MWRRRRYQAALMDTAHSYATQFGWPVAPGASLQRPWRAGGRHRADHRVDDVSCSCGNPQCPAPGGHPAHRDWQDEATIDPKVLADWWRGSACPNLILPTGYRFDVIDAPGDVARLALRWIASDNERIGPVAVGATDRYLFFTATSRDGERPPLTAELAYYGPGQCVLAPPSSLGPLGTICWLRAPDRRDATLPDPAVLAHRLVDASRTLRARWHPLALTTERRAAVTG
jgi:hypothetical protein